MTLQQTVTIPADRRLHLDWTLPPDTPKGPTELILRAKTPEKERRIPIIS